MSATEPVQPPEKPTAAPSAAALTTDRDPSAESPANGAEFIEAPVPAWRRRLGVFTYDFVGLAFAVALFCLSVTPSLLPRSGLLQGAISGVLATTGYGLGVLLVWIVRRLLDRPAPLLRPNRWAWLILAGVSLALIVVFLVLGSAWQRDIHRLMGMQPPRRYGYAIVLLIAVGLFVLFVGLGRLLRRGARALARLLGRWIPATAARLISTTAVILLLVFTLNGVVVDAAMSFADAAFKKVNAETEPGVDAPSRGTRSGGPGSLVSWASLGNQGRNFVAGGPTAAQLRAFSGTDPTDPIRVYAGLGSAVSPGARANVAVRELLRTGAFSRKVLVVITTTGTGWVDAKAVDPLEYMYNGDTAMVGMQYSYLPSWLSFLVDQARAREAGRDLFDEVYRVWSTLPVGQRPKLLVFGESLGSFGAETAFSGSADMRNRTDGMLLIGPPNSNTLWREFVSDRKEGTTEVQPTYRDGDTVRFAADPDDLESQPGTWTKPRVVYLQHPSDPIVWWSWDLMLTRPGWLEEKRGDDVLPAMRWYPFVTFWQVAADMAFATGVPGGHGHNYGTEPVKAWAVIAPPDGWTDERTTALEQTMTKGG